MGTKPRFEEEAKGNSQMAYYACVCTATSENGIPLRHNTSTRMFTTRGYVCPVKTQSPDYLTPKQFGGFGWFSMCLCLRRISFSLASSLLLSFVLASLVKTRVNSPLFGTYIICLFGTFQSKKGSMRWDLSALEEACFFFFTLRAVREICVVIGIFVGYKTFLANVLSFC